jgi:hypothetical protein
MQPVTMNDQELATVPPPAPSGLALEQAWFDSPPSSRRISTVPPSAPVEKLGEFLGDELADAWLR